MEPVKSARILREGSAPGYGHREKQRVEARIVKTFTEVTAGCHDDTLFTLRYGLQGVVHLITLLCSHSTFQDNDVLGELRQTLCNCLKVVLALRDHDRGSPSFESREHVIEDHIISSRIAGQ